MHARIPSMHPALNVLVNFIEFFFFSFWIFKKKKKSPTCVHVGQGATKRSSFLLVTNRRWCNNLHAVYYNPHIVIFSISRQSDRIAFNKSCPPIKFSLRMQLTISFFSEVSSCHNERKNWIFFLSLSVISQEFGTQFSWNFIFIHENIEFFFKSCKFIFYSFFF